MKTAIRRICALALAATMVSAGMAHAQQMPPSYEDKKVAEGACWRANLRRTGTYETAGIPKAAALKWKFDTGGPVRSSPVELDGAVYVGTDAGFFVSLDAETGEEKWRVQVEGGVLSSACSADGVVYFGGRDGKLYAVHAATGEVKWATPGRNGLGTSPAVAYGLVFVQGSYACDAETGEVVWTTGKTKRIVGRGDERSSTIVYKGLVVENGSVADIRTGRWIIGRGDTWAGQNTEALADGVFYNTNSGVGGAVNLPQLLAIDLETGKKLWARNIIAPGQSANVRKVVLCSPTVFDGFVYIGFDGALMFAFDAKTGEDRWTFETGGPIRSSASVSAADATIYFGCDDGRLYALDARTGELRWTFEAEGGIRSTACVHDGVVFFGSDDGHVYALKSAE